MKNPRRQANAAPTLKQDPLREFLATYTNRWSRVGVATVGAAMIAAQLTAVGFAYEVKMDSDRSYSDIPMISSNLDYDGPRWIEVAESDKNNKAAAPAPKAEEKKAEPAKAEPAKAEPAPKAEEKKAEPAKAAPQAEEKKGGGDNKPAPAQSSGSTSGTTSTGSSNTGATSGGNKSSGGTTTTSGGTTSTGTLPGGTMGKSGSNPDGGGVDKPYSADGQPAGSQPNTGFQDGNNGCGQDKRIDGGGDDNNGWCGFKPKPEKKENTGLKRTNSPVETTRENDRVIVKNNTEGQKGEVKFGDNDKAQIKVEDKDKDKVEIKKSDSEKDVVTIKVKGEDQDRVKVRVIDNDSVDIKVSDHDKVTVKIADKDKDKILFTVNPNNPNQGFFELVNADREQVKFNGYLGPNGVFILDVTSVIATNSLVSGPAATQNAVTVTTAPSAQVAPIAPVVPAVQVVPAAPVAPIVQIGPVAAPVIPAVQVSAPASPQAAPVSNATTAVQAAPAVVVPATNVQQPTPLPIAMQLAPLMPLNPIQVDAVATLLGGGVTTSDVSTMTAGQIQRAAEVKGIAPSDFVAVLGAQYRRPFSNVLPSTMPATGGPSTGLVAAGLAMLSGAGLFLRRIGRNRD